MHNKHFVRDFTYVIAGFEHPLHVLVHVVVIERHEERVNDDAKCDKKFNERIKHQQGHPLLKLQPDPTAIPDAKDVDAPEKTGQQLVLERRLLFIVVCRKVIGRNCNAR